MRKPRSAGHKEKTAPGGAHETERPHGSIEPERRDVSIEHVMRADTADAFIRNPDDGPVNVDDDLAETLAEEFVHSATSGEDQTEAALDQMVPEEIGGPFVETSGEDEFADDVDGSNPEDAEAEPLPRAVNGLSAGIKRE
jgi:hypothetical protein